jgi:hypothetical protein
MPNGEDHSADSERFLNELLSAAPAAQFRRSKASSPPRAQILYNALALQLRYLRGSESMGNHDSKIVDAASVD